MTTVDTQPAIRTKLYDLLNGIDPPIGRVWKRERTGLSQYRYNGVIQAWTIMNADPNGGKGEERMPLDTCSYKAYRTYTIRGYMTIDDANDSTSAFDDLIRVVMNTLTPKRSLEGTAIDHGLAQLVFSGTASIETNLVHYCEITLVVMSQETVDQWT